MSYQRFNGATFLGTWKRQCCARAPSTRCPLQWSHVPANVETRAAALCARWRGSASMEPRSCERGNMTAPHLNYVDQRLLQWSHVPANVETFLCHRHWRLLPQLQWSHVPANVETRPVTHTID